METVDQRIHRDLITPGSAQLLIYFSYLMMYQKETNYRTSKRQDLNNKTCFRNMIDILIQQIVWLQADETKMTNLMMRKQKIIESHNKKSHYNA